MFLKFVSADPAVIAARAGAADGGAAARVPLPRARGAPGVSGEYGAEARASVLSAWQTGENCRQILAASDANHLVNLSRPLGRPGPASFQPA